MTGLYYFLSYAHSVPLDDQDHDADRWVRRFHQDLSAEVARMAQPAPGTAIGFFDGLLPAMSDWRTEQSKALSRAEVFVSLYSPNYLEKLPELHERNLFRRRLEASGVDPKRSAQHVVPVLWTPFPAGRQNQPATTNNPEIIEAYELGVDVADYSVNGLGALCRLKAYGDSYRKILRRLAHRIVDLAEQNPLGPTPVPLDFGVTTQVRPMAPRYVVAALAPSQIYPPERGPLRNYGETSAAWRPFGVDHAQPIVEYVATVADRQGMQAEIVDGRRLALLRSSPGMLLIDPWICAVASGEAALHAAIDRLPDWVTPLLVIDQKDAEWAAHAGGLANRIMDMSAMLGVTTLRAIWEAEEFVQIVPGLVRKSRSRFLSTRPTDGPAPTQRPSLRPRLRDRGEGGW